MIFIKNKSMLCLGVVTLFTVFFLARSIVVRERYIASTFLSSSPHQDVTAASLAYSRNWLKDGIFALSGGLYVYPASVEMPTLEQRYFYASYPPGHVIPIYLLFKILDSSGLVANIDEQRGAQLVLITAYNYLLHFLLALVLCYLAFLLCRKLGFDRLNSTVLAIIPAFVQFHTAGSLYHHHLFYTMESAVILPFALYALLEFLRIAPPSPRILQAVRVLQPLVVFYGVLIDWFFIFVMLTVYIIRLLHQARPASPARILVWLKQSFLFFAPALPAIGLWLYQITYYAQRVVQQNITTAKIAGVEGTELTLLDKLLGRIGLADGIDHYIYYLATAFLTHIQNNYGLLGLVMLYVTLWAAWRGRKFMSEDSSVAQVANTYLILVASGVAYNLFFMQHSFVHMFSVLKFSPALSLAFVCLPVFILQMWRKRHLLPAVHLTATRNISLVTVIALSSSMLYGYAQIVDKHSITKMFSPPDYRHVLISNFVKANTSYSDVLFSNFYYVRNSYSRIRLNFVNKVIHYAHNLDYIYHKTKAIEQDFTVKILYQEGNPLSSLRDFLSANNIAFDDIKEEQLGLLTFDGRQFIAWYEQVHECDAHPQHCEKQEQW